MSKRRFILSLIFRSNFLVLPVYDGGSRRNSDGLDDDANSVYNMPNVVSDTSLTPEVTVHILIIRFY